MRTREIAGNYGLQWCWKNNGEFLNSWSLTDTVSASSARFSSRVMRIIHAMIVIIQWLLMQLNHLESMMNSLLIFGLNCMQLLDILASNYVSGGQIEGDILVNGKERNDYVFRKQSCYVLQQDVLLSSATVRESITTSALLKLPMSLTKEEKLAMVDKVLEELHLVECQNTLIGDELQGIKGISGGQKRRVSIGIELVKGMFSSLYGVM